MNRRNFLSKIIPAAVPILFLPKLITVNWKATTACFTWPKHIGFAVTPGNAPGDMVLRTESGREIYLYKPHFTPMFVWPEHWGKVRPITPAVLNNITSP